MNAYEFGNFLAAQERATTKTAAANNNVASAVSSAYAFGNLVATNPELVKQADMWGDLSQGFSQGLEEGRAARKARLAATPAAPADPAAPAAPAAAAPPAPATPNPRVATRPSRPKPAPGMPGNKITKTPPAAAPNVAAAAPPAPQQKKPLVPNVIRPAQRFRMPPENAQAASPAPANPQQQAFLDQMAESALANRPRDLRPSGSRPTPLPRQSPTVSPGPLNAMADPIPSAPTAASPPAMLAPADAAPRMPMREHMRTGQ